MAGDSPSPGHGTRILLGFAAGFVAVLAVAIGAVVWIADRSGFAERISEPPPTAAERLAEAEETPTLALVPLRTDAESDAPAELVQRIDAALSELLGGGGLRLPSAAQLEPFRDKDVTPAEVAEALGVRYVVLATVGGRDTEVRIDAVLHDVVLGNSIFRGSFYGERAAVASVQAEVASALLAALENIRG